MSERMRSALAALSLEERLRRTCAGCGLSPIDRETGRCPSCGAVKAAWEMSEAERAAESRR